MLPEIVFVVNQCAKFMCNPGPMHLITAKRILCYLKGTAKLWITYTRADTGGKGNVIWAFADADHAGDPDTCQSVTGYILMMNGGAISWSSTYQAVVALISSDAEFYAALNCTCYISYMRIIMGQFGFDQQEPTIIFEDNWACIYLSKNSVLYHKSKHINVRVYHLSDLCNARVMELIKVGTNDQVAYVFTKSLPLPVFAKHRKMMLGMWQDHLDYGNK